MRVQRWSWLLSAGVGTVALLAILWLLSPWFLWHLLPENVVFKVVLKSDRRIATLVPGLQVVEPLLETSAQVGVAIARDGQTLFIIRPTVAGYFSLRRELTDAGWQTQWYGPWLLAGQDGRVEHRSFWQASRGWWQSYNPLFIAEGKLPTLDKAVRAVATAVGPEWRIVVREVGSVEQTSGLPNRPPQHIQAEVAELSLPGTALAGLPEYLKNAWNERLRESFGFIKTRPDFITELAHYRSAQLTVGVTGPRLAVFEQNERWEVTVKQWVEEEERQFRIQKRSFRLPDGTFGAEFVPGPRQVLFTGSAAHPTCSEAVVQERHFWLCNDVSSLFTSSEDLLATSTLPTTVEVALGQNFLPVIAEKELQAATAVISTEQTLLRLLWTSKQ